MREILFRGFYPNENGTEKVLVNGEWIKGYWIENNSVYQTKSGTYLDFLGMYRAVIPETVCQYTGLKDKNGNMIFEGDILICKRYVGGNFIEYHLEKGYVEMKHGAFGLYRKQGFYRPFKDWLEDYEYEIIGNIHSNPELLEVVE